jgi:Mg/Co/Ni transporter MgtE
VDDFNKVLDGLLVHKLTQVDDVYADEKAKIVESIADSEVQKVHRSKRMNMKATINDALKFDDKFAERKAAGKTVSLKLQQIAASGYENLAQEAGRKSRRKRK